METELKYACPDGAILAQLLCAESMLPLMTEPVRRIRMETTYYDTPDRALRARRWTLRLRRENDCVVATCKTAGTQQGALTSHGEWEAEAATIAQALPALRAAGAPEALLELAGRGVEPVCGAAFLRCSVNLALEGGTIAELSCDQGELRGATQTSALCEVELELKQGALAPMLQLGAAMSARWGLEPETRSKLARALELR